MTDNNEYRRNLAFRAGAKAARDGKPETANNRERGTIFYDDWADGWNETRNSRASASRPSGQALFHGLVANALRSGVKEEDDGLAAD